MNNIICTINFTIMTEKEIKKGKKWDVMSDMIERHRDKKFCRINCCENNIIHTSSWW